MLNPWYVTGFSDGEAAFTYSKARKGLSLYFAIKVNSEERKLIEQIRDFFGVGKIYEVKPTPPRAYSGFTGAAVYYRITKIDELDRIVQHFDKYPLHGKKLESYQIWREIFLLKKKFRKPDFEKLRKLAAVLSKLSSKNTALRRKRKEIFI